MSRVPVKLCTNLCYHMQAGGGVRATQEYSILYGLAGTIAPKLQCRYRYSRHSLLYMGFRRLKALCRILSERLKYTKRGTQINTVRAVMAYTN